MNLYAIDLNLLVALDALLRERHVTRAAKAIGLSQPAMSNALARLRELLDDQLLIRTPDGMRPTPRAEDLAPPLADALRTIRDSVLAPRRWDPMTATNTFRIATHDYEQLVLLPALVKRLGQEAPGVRLEVSIPTERVPIEDLYQGRIDAALAVEDVTHGGLYRATLTEERFVCVFRAGHPQANQRLTPARFAALDHLLVSPFGGMSGFVDKALEAQKLKRVVKLAVPQFSMAPWVLINSDYVLTFPERPARLFAAHLPLKVVKTPIPVPSFKEYLYWHERTRDDPAHRWLRQLIRDVSADESAGDTGLA